MDSKSQNPWYKKWWVVLIILLSAFSLVFVVLNPPRTERIKDVQVIKCKVKEIEDHNLELGKRETEQDCVDGKREITYEIEYFGDTESSRKQISDEITVRSVDKIIRVGTKKEEPKKQSPSPKPTPTPAPAIKKNTSNNSSSNSGSGSQNYSPNSGVKDVVTGYCNDGTKVQGRPDAKGKANVCWGRGGWRDY